MFLEASFYCQCVVAQTHYRRTLGEEQQRRRARTRFEREVLGRDHTLLMLMLLLLLLLLFGGDGSTPRHSYASRHRAESEQSSTATWSGISFSIDAGSLFDRYIYTYLGRYIQLNHYDIFLTEMTKTSSM